MKSKRRDALGVLREGVQRPETALARGYPADGAAMRVAGAARTDISNDIMEPVKTALSGGAMSKETQMSASECETAAEPRPGRAAAPKAMPKERLTEDLLARLLESKTPEAYLAQGEAIDRELPDYLYSLLDARGMNRSQVARISCINTTFLYNIFEGKSKPKRDNALMLAFALGCDLRETQRLLRLAGVSELWPKVKRDAIIIWCIEHGYTREECDDELYRLKERVIFKVTGELQ